MPGPGIEPPTSGMPSGCDNHYTTAPLTLLHLGSIYDSTKTSLAKILRNLSSMMLQINGITVGNVVNIKKAKSSQADESPVRL